MPIGVICALCVLPQKHKQHYAHIYEYARVYFWIVYMTVCVCLCVCDCVQFSEVCTVNWCCTPRVNQCVGRYFRY